MENTACKAHCICNKSREWYKGSCQEWCAVYALNNGTCSRTVWRFLVCKVQSIFNGFVQCFLPALSPKIVLNLLSLMILTRLKSSCVPPASLPAFSSAVSSFNRRFSAPTKAARLNMLSERVLSLFSSLPNARVFNLSRPAGTLWINLQFTKQLRGLVMETHQRFR